MAELKTRPTDQSALDFINSQPDEQRRTECRLLLDLFRQATGEEPRMWGSSIVGFGSRHYVYASGREGDWPPVAFSPRKQALTLYLMRGLDEVQDLLARLGRHTTGKGCLYIKKLTDVDVQVLTEIIRRSYTPAEG